MAPNLFLILSFVAVVRSQTSCFRCEDVLRPSDCQTVVTCGPHQTCYSDEYQTPDGRKAYNLGCRAKMTCERNSVRNKPLLEKCSECCTGDYCNQYLCDQKRDRPPGVQCFNCQGISNPTTCGQITTCPVDNQCYTEFVITDQHNTRFNMGCQRTKTCELLASHNARALMSIDENIEHLCQQCCSENFCNRELCAAYYTSSTKPPIVPSEVMIEEAPPSPNNQKYEPNHPLSCYRCSGISTPSECRVLVTCQENQICYTDETSSPDGRRTYDIGCRDKQVCLAGQETENGRCSECCEEDYCNVGTCGVKAADPPGLQCFGCQDIDNPRNCGLLTTCPVDTQCYTELVLTDMLRMRYNMGCKMDKTCELLGAQGKRDLSGHKQKRLENLCQACCSDNFCNKEICAPSTIPQAATTDMGINITVGVTTSAQSTTQSTLAANITASAITASETSVSGTMTMTSATTVANLTTTTTAVAQSSSATVPQSTSSRSTLPAETSTPTTPPTSTAVPLTTSTPILTSNSTSTKNSTVAQTTKLQSTRVTALPATNASIVIITSSTNTPYTTTQQPSSTVGGLSCLACKNIHDPRTCTQMHQCKRHEDACYVKRTLGHHGAQKYDMGCTEDRHCRNTSHAYDLCCSENGCNANLISDPVVMCNTCEHSKSSDNCTDSVVCLEGETCYSRGGIHGTVHPLYDYGCIPKEDCVLDADRTPPRGGYAESCFNCCEGDQCNQAGQCQVTVPDIRQCMSCIGEENPEACRSSAVCPEGEGCYYFRQLRNGKLVHDFGCASNDHCNALSSALPDCQFTTNSSAECVTCCNTDHCNRHIQTERRCLYCVDVDNPKDCHTTITCPLGEECYYFREPRNGKLAHDFGCSSQSNCQKLSSFLPECTASGVQSEQCISCCSQDHCNRDYTQIGR